MSNPQNRDVRALVLDFDLDLGQERIVVVVDVAGRGRTLAEHRH